MSGASIILLCEDKLTDSFVRRFLKHRNFSGRDIRTLPLPAGSQSGEQWVRQRYPNELKVVRQKQDTFLIVVTDADNFSTEVRRAKLKAECERQKVPPKNDNDSVIQIIPRRNIETWLAYLDGSEVDECKLYSKFNYESNYKEHAKQLYNMCHKEQKLREPAPPSLLEACEEYRKLQR